MRTLIFGIDGLTFRIISPLIERGELPNFKKLRDEGCEAILESKYPPLTPPAWTSLSTGLKPARYGVYDYWVYADEAKRGVTRSVHVQTQRRAEKAIWNILSEYGKQVLIINFFFQAEDGIRDYKVTGVQTCALPISALGDSAENPKFVETLPKRGYRFICPVEEITSNASGGNTKEIAIDDRPEASPETKIGRASCRERV